MGGGREEAHTVPTLPALGAELFPCATLAKEGAFQASPAPAAICLQQHETLSQNYLAKLFLNF